MSDADQVDARESQATVGADVPAVPDKPSGMRRVAHILGAVLVAVVLPALLMAALVGSLGVSALFVGLVLGVEDGAGGAAHRPGLIASAKPAP
jgi:hypothetical protein